MDLLIYAVVKINLGFGGGLVCLTGTNKNYGLDNMIRKVYVKKRSNKKHNNVHKMFRMPIAHSTFCIFGSYLHKTTRFAW